MDPTKGEVTRLVERWSQGDASALDRLIEIAYDDLRQIASRRLDGWRHGHTIETTALVHELYLRLAGVSESAWGGALSVLRLLLEGHAAHPDRLRASESRHEAWRRTHPGPAARSGRRRGNRTHGTPGARRGAGGPGHAQRTHGTHRRMPILRRALRAGNGRGGGGLHPHRRARVGAGAGCSSGRDPTSSSSTSGSRRRPASISSATWTKRRPSCS